MTARPALLWFGLFGGIAAWSIHLLASYLAISVLCARSPDAGQIALVATSTVSLLIAVSAAWAARTVGTTAVGWRQFLSRFGLLLDALAIAGVLLAGTLPAALPACA